MLASAVQAPAEEWKAGTTALAEAAVAANAAASDTRSHANSEPPQPPDTLEPGSEPGSPEASPAAQLSSPNPMENEAPLLQQRSHNSQRAQHAALDMEPSAPLMHGNDRDRDAGAVGGMPAAAANTGSVGGGLGALHSNAADDVVGSLEGMPPHPSPINFCETAPIVWCLVASLLIFSPRALVPPFTAANRHNSPGQS